MQILKLGLDNKYFYIKTKKNYLIYLIIKKLIKIFNLYN